MNIGSPTAFFSVSLLLKRLNVLTYFHDGGFGNWLRQFETDTLMTTGQLLIYLLTSIRLFSLSLARKKARQMKGGALWGQPGDRARKMNGDRKKAECK